MQWRRCRTQRLSRDLANCRAGMAVAQPPTVFASALSYELFFDIREQPLEWWLPAASLLLLTVLGLLYWARRKARWLIHGRAWLENGRASLLLGLLFIWSTVNTLMVVSPRHAARKALANGLSPVAEGCVEDFRSTESYGIRFEDFNVAGVHFAYSELDLTPGFNGKGSRRRPIQAGQQVRIHYGLIAEKPTILRLEVNSGPCSAATNESEDERRQGRRAR